MARIFEQMNVPTLIGLTLLGNFALAVLIAR